MEKTARTEIAFARYRAGHEPDQAMNPAARRYLGDIDPMGPDDGLTAWIDGPVNSPGPQPPRKPDLGKKPEELRLWIITRQSVLHAPEDCEFGAEREAGAVKHSNLTGGSRAFAGGELVFLDPEAIAITGSSGRYRLRSGSEMAAIERAFLESGYKVWSMGYNQDVNRPNLFGLSDPQWVAS